MANLRLGLAKLNVCGGQVRVLRFIEFVSVFKLFFENCQIRSAHLQCWNVLPRDLRLYPRSDKWLLGACLLHRWQVLIALFILLLTEVGARVDSEWRFCILVARIIHLRGLLWLQNFPAWRSSALGLLIVLECNSTLHLVRLSHFPFFLDLRRRVRLFSRWLVICKLFVHLRDFTLEPH